MKFYFAFIAFILFSITVIGQKPATGTYIFKYCDLEYDRCLSTCMVVIKKDSIIIYATKELSKAITNTKEGEIVNQGLLLKHKTGKWIIGKSRKDRNAKDIGVEGPAIMDFKTKEYWTF